MSILLPLSADQTAIVSPTSDSLIARMSSISGPGQKLPRASTVRAMVAVMLRSVPSMWAIRARRSGSGRSRCAPLRARGGLDEQRAAALGHEADHRCGTDRLAHALDQVIWQGRNSTPIARATSRSSFGLAMGVEF